MDCHANSEDLRKIGMELDEISRKVDYDFEFMALLTSGKSGESKVREVMHVCILVVFRVNWRAIPLIAQNL